MIAKVLLIAVKLNATHLFRDFNVKSNKKTQRGDYLSAKPNVIASTQTGVFSGLKTIPQIKPFVC